MTGKIAFLILAHNDPEMLYRLVSALDYPMFELYIHLDKKSNIDNFEFDKYNLKFSKVHIIENRVAVHWGGFSIVEATLEMYKAALMDGNYIRYVTLSGNDYPIQSNDVIYAQLSNLEKEYIAGNPEYHLHKIRKYYFFDYGTVGRIAGGILRRFGIVYNKKPLTLNGKNYEVFFAPQWHALSHGCVEEFMSTIKCNKREICKFFRFSYAPDELMIPTLVFNGSFRDNCIKADFSPEVHYNEKPAIHYINYEPIVQVFERDDFSTLVDSGKLFARKLRSKQSLELIRLIDNRRKE